MQNIIFLFSFEYLPACTPIAEQDSAPTFRDFCGSGTLFRDAGVKIYSHSST